MKKITLTLSLFTFLMNVNNYSQTHFSENFENGLPNNWTQYRGQNNIGSGEDWRATGAGYVSDSAVYVGEEFTGGITTEDWLVTPLITLGASNNELNFFMGQSYSSDWGSTYEVRVSTASQVYDTTFTTVKTWTENDFPSGIYSYQTVNLSAYNGQSVYIAFVLTQNDGDSWIVDDVVVESNTCSRPLNLTTITITSTDATLSWGGNGANYEVAYVSDFNSPNAANVLVSSTNYTLTGLTNNTLVTYKVREICGAGDTSQWSNSYSFTTLCATTISLPYVQDFETDTNSYLPCGWVRENNNLDNKEWQIAKTAGAKSGVRQLGIEYNGSVAMDDWVISPNFFMYGGAEYSLSFSYGTYLGVGENFSFYYGTGQNSTNLTNLIESFSNITTGATWVDTTIKFTPSVSGNYSIGIHGTSVADQYFIAIDDFDLSGNYTVQVDNNELNSENILIYPNPNNGIFTINNKTDNTLNGFVYDVNGRRIMELTSLIENSSVKVNLHELEKGIYFVTLRGGKSFINKKITVH